MALQQTGLSFRLALFFWPLLCVVLDVEGKVK